MSILSLFSPFAWIRRLISLTLVLLIGFYIYCGYLVYSASQVPTTAAGLRPAGTVVIIDPTSDTTQLSADTLSRLNQAISIYISHPAKQVIIVEKGRSATFAKEYLVSNKIPASRIKVFSSSSISDAFSVLAESKVTANSLITVVADALQAVYIENLAAYNHLKVQVSPAINSEAVSLSWVGQLAKEASAVAVGKIIGFTRVDWG